MWSLRAIIITVCIVVVLVLVLVAIGWWLRRHRRARRDARITHLGRVSQRSDVVQNTIFVSIPSYRDPEAVHTLYSLFHQSDCPYRVFVGLCVQDTKDEPDMLKQYQQKVKHNNEDKDYSDNIRVLTMDAEDAKGPVYARALIEKKLYRDEKYYMTIDSHMRFAPKWDTKSIEFLESASQRWGSEKPLLTMYPDGYHAVEDESETRPGSYLRIKKFDSSTGFVELEGPLMKKVPSYPIPTPFLGACYTFSSAERIREVPHDADLTHVFIGEEISMAVRLWTHGWDMFSPPQMLCAHKWSRKYRHTFWELFEFGHAGASNRKKERDQAYARLRSLLNVPGNKISVSQHHRYGLGTKRTLLEYQRYAGIDMSKQHAEWWAWVGVTSDNPPAAEVEAKFSSWAALERAKGRAKKRAQQKNVAVDGGS